MEQKQTFKPTPLNVQHQDITHIFRWINLGVICIALLGGAAAMFVEPRFGLLATALIVGWTQLVGL